MARQYHNIRIPIELHKRLCRAEAKVLAAKVAAKGYDKVPLAEQGAKVHVPHYAMIALALDEWEDKRRRSNPGKNKRKQ